MFKPADDPAAYARGYDWAKKACELGSGVGCSLAFSFELYSGAANPAVQLRFYQRGCGLGELRMCRMLASAYLRGSGLAKDEAKGVELLTRACEGRDASACGDLVLHLQRSDPARALSIATKTCDGNDRASYICAQAAAIMVKQERYEQAVPYAKKACDAKFTWCRPLIKMYQTGKGAKSDPAAADVLIKKICADQGEKLSDSSSDDPICGAAKGAPSKPTTTLTTTTPPTTPTKPTKLTKK